MTAFAAAINTIFSDPNMTKVAEYQSVGGGDPIPDLKVIRTAPDAETAFNAGRFVGSTFVIDVRLVDVPDAQPGDTFTIDSVTHTVIGDPLRDSERLVWKCETRVDV